MTPKEKAEELVDRFHIKVHVSFVENSIPSVVNALMLYDSAKQCALIAVDEIINTNPKITINWAFSGIQEFDNVNYWQEVKKEIEKL
jgi:hypothetical protein